MRGFKRALLFLGELNHSAAPEESAPKLNRYLSTNSWWIRLQEKNFNNIQFASFARSMKELIDFKVTVPTRALKKDGRLQSGAL